MPTAAFYVGACHALFTLVKRGSHCLLEVSVALQVFDKALTETTFCEIYADLCFQLNSMLPSFEPQSQEGKKRTSTFRSASPLCLAATVTRCLLGSLQ